MNPLDYKSLTTEAAAEYLSKVLLFLKKNGFNQRQVQEQIGYNYLTKLKDHTTYGKEMIGGKSRQEVLKMIFKEFGLNYVGEDTFVFGEKKQLNTSAFYIIYTASFGYPLKMGKGLVEITKSNRLIVSLMGTNDLIKDVKSIWKGELEAIGSYIALDIKRAGGNVIPVKAHFSFYRGVSDIDRVLLGTYAGVSYDGEPTAGKAVLAKEDSKENAEKKINEGVPFQVEMYLRDRVNLSKRVNVSTIDKIPNRFKLENLFGEYLIFYPVKTKGVRQGTLSIHLNSKVSLITTSREYEGQIMYQDRSLFFIELSDKDFDFDVLDSQIRIMMKTNSFYRTKAFNGIMSSSTNNSPVSRFFIALRKEEFLKKSEKEINEIVTKYFDSYIEVRSKAIDLYEFKDIILSDKSE